MSDLPRTATHSDLVQHRQSIHHEFIKKAIPDWIQQVSSKRIDEFKRSPKHIPEWVKGASTQELAALKVMAAENGHAQNAADRVLDRLKDVHSFAEPIVSKALKEQFGIDEDVRDIYLRIYAPVRLSPWTVVVN